MVVVTKIEPSLSVKLAQIIPFELLPQLLAKHRPPGEDAIPTTDHSHNSAVASTLQ